VSGYDDIPCKVAGYVPRGDKSGELRLSAFVSAPEQRTMSVASAYALVAAHEALHDAQWNPQSTQDRRNTGG
jgi:3-oxoacyl-[acyl-carrier-protein] synthase II